MVEKQFEALLDFIVKQSEIAPRKELMGHLYNEQVRINKQVALDQAFNRVIKETESEA